MDESDLALFRAYPALRRALPRVALGPWPTPVARLERLGQEAGIGALYVKRDDQSGTCYGGNKVRKLELLLARAKADGAAAVLTFGAAGSNHALATAIYARELGLRCHAMLVPQHNARSVGRNLLRGHVAGAALHCCAGKAHVTLAVAEVFRREYFQCRRFPAVYPPGGSSALGTVGFVSAAFELKEQVLAGVLPEPDRIYVASGTMGTCVGLLLGLRAAGMATQLHAVAVTQWPFSSVPHARKLYGRVNALLHEADPSFLRYPFPEGQFVLRDEYFGKDYALYTEEGCAAVRRMKETEGLSLEGTYTGKTFAAVLGDAAKGALKDQRVLFWNTYNGRDFSADIAGLDYHALPPGFHRYFEEPVQPLDR
jgi:D-cysteine desulfhydrase